MRHILTKPLDRFFNLLVPAKRKHYDTQQLKQFHNFLLTVLGVLLALNDALLSVHCFGVVIPNRNYVLKGVR